MKSRITFQIAVLICVISTLLGGVFTWLDYRVQSAAWRRAHEQRAELAIQRLGRGAEGALWDLDDARLEGLLLAEMKDPGLVGAAVFEGKPGELKFKRAARRDAADAPALVPEWRPGEDLERALPVLHDGQPIGEVRMEFSQAELRRYLRELLLAKAAQTLLLNVLLGAAVFLAMHYRLVVPLRRVMHALRAGATELGESVDTLEKNSATLAAQGNGETEIVDQSSQSLAAIATATRHNADRATDAKAHIAEARAATDEGTRLMTSLGDAMGQIEHSSQDISAIIRVINEIAFQTNLLALNAAVEAARAGSAGAGFAVVADQVHALALRSSQAARETEEKLARSTNYTLQGVNVSATVGATLSKIAEKVTHVDEIMRDVAAASADQTRGLDALTFAVEKMDQAVRVGAETARDGETISRKVASQADVLGNVVNELRRLLDGHNARA